MPRRPWAPPTAPAPAPEEVPAAALRDLWHHLNTLRWNLESFHAAAGASGDLTFLRACTADLDACEAAAGTLGAAEDTDVTAEPVDVNGTVDDILAILGPRLGKHVAVTRAAGNIPRVRGQPAAVRRSILNVILNAVESVEPEGGRLRISTRHSGRTVAVRVNDSGPGIPLGASTGAFDASSTPIGPGSGLALARQLMRRVGGTVTAWNPPGGGTEVVLHFPAVTT